MSWSLKERGPVSSAYYSWWGGGCADGGGHAKENSGDFYATSMQLAGYARESSDLNLLTVGNPRRGRSRYAKFGSLRQEDLTLRSL